MVEAAIRGDDAPFIVTLALDDVAHAHFDELRRQFFPRDRLHVGAHVTMFHALPAATGPRLMDKVAEICAAAAPFRIVLTGTIFLGRGVAYSLISPEAQRIRAEIAGCFAACLTRQDSARWSPHITIQNKVSPETARRTQETLEDAAQPDEITGTGIAVWRYRGGPWESVCRFSFGRIGT